MLLRFIAAILGVCVFAAAAQAAQVIYVDDDAAEAGNGTSWQNACKYLQDALSLAVAGAKPVEVRVARGVYKPDQGAGVTPGDQTAAFHLLNGVMLKGGYAGAAAPDPNARDVSLYETILSGDLAGNDGSDGNRSSEDSCHVVTGNLVDSTAGMDGMTIAGDNPFSAIACRPSPGREARVLLDAASPTIRNCQFIGLSRIGSGVAVSVVNDGSPVFIDCSFTDYGDAMVIEAAGPTLQNCLFSGDWTAVACGEGSTPSLMGCRFESNTVGVSVGVTNSSHTSPTLTSCTFFDNFTGLHVLSGDVSVNECLFESNGGSVEISSGNLGLTGCRFNGNRRTCIGGTGDVVLRRCSFIGNTGGLVPVAVTVGSLMVDGCTFVNNSAMVTGAISGPRFLTLRNCEFSGNVGGRTGAVDAGSDVFRATGCLFTGNSGQHTGALDSHAAVFSLSNCTFADNRGQVAAVRYDKPGPACPAQITQCVIWNGPAAILEESPKEGAVAVTYCDVRGGHAGEGNIDVDPYFVAPGHWADPNDPSVVLDREDPNAVWVQGDYHVKSQAGHWDREAVGWVLDDVTSPCIDAGDPNRPIGEEPFPNGGFVNMGTYGGTAEAGRTYFGGPVCETQIAGDINGDCVVDETDTAILTSHWLMQGWPTADVPPTVAIVEPNDGDEFSDTAPITIRAEAFDPDGSVVGAVFSLEHMDENGGIGMGRVDIDPSDGWKYDWPWTNVVSAGSTQVWTIRAEAMDDYGNIAVSPEITVTVHRKK
jgi:hypothetical protein